MEEKLISFITAMLAKDAGFDVRCEYQYVERDGMVTLSKDHLSEMDEYAPTQSALQTWLRNKGIMIWVVPIFYDGWNFACEISYPDGTYLAVGVEDGTWEEQLEDGLKTALNALILYKKEKVWTKS